MWGGGPFWYHFHCLLSKTNHTMVPVGTSVGSFQAEHHKGFPHPEQCSWLARSVLAQFTIHRKRIDRQTWLHWQYAHSQQQSAPPATYTMNHLADNLHRADEYPLLTPHTVASVFPSLQGSMHAVAKWRTRVQMYLILFWLILSFPAVLPSVWENHVEDWDYSSNISHYQCV